MSAACKIKSASVARRVRALSSFFDWLTETKMVPTNPTIGLSLPKETRRPPKALGAQELYRLRRAVYKGRNSRDVAIFEMLVQAGLRVSELCSLTGTDVEITERDRPGEGPWEG